MDEVHGVEIGVPEEEAFVAVCANVCSRRVYIGSDPSYYQTGYRYLILLSWYAAYSITRLLGTQSAHNPLCERYSMVAVVITNKLIVCGDVSQSHVEKWSTTELVVSCPGVLQKKILQLVLSRNHAS